tara:strand:+ start:965 stop:1429 length:465 start_codon:yes stop_codon:yes gene_type:complete
MVIVKEIKKNQQIDLLLYICTNNFEMITKVINEENINSIIDIENGNTPLHMAIIMNNEKIIRYLFELGGDLMIENKNGEDSLDLLLKFGNPLLFDFLEEGLEKEYINNYTLIDELKNKNLLLEKEISNLKIENDKLNNNFNQYPFTRSKKRRLD